MADVYNIQSPFIGKNIILRAIEMSDLEEIMKYFNNYETRLGLGDIIPFSSKQEEEWIKRTIENYSKGTEYNFVIEHKETKEFLGTCGIGSFSTSSRSAELGIGIHNPENFDKGYGTDAMICLMKFGFRVHNLHRIELGLHSYNERAYHVYKKLGWKEVGRKRDFHFMQGTYYDTIIMDILEHEFEEMYTEE
ncbi:MAG: GNAT family N-acetyltransferase [Candidatus Heimdallarchaeaceae archaeon]